MSLFVSVASAQNLEHHFIDPKHLAKPGATKSVLSTPITIPMPEGFKLTAPKGFTVSEFATGLSNPRWMAEAPNGDVFVVEAGLSSTSKFNRVILLRDSKGIGKADFRSEFATKLSLPFGIAFQGKYIYVANTGSVVRWPYRPGQTKADGPGEVVIKGIPERGYNQHWTRNILFDKTGRKLYLTIGSISNANVEEARRGTVEVYDCAADSTPNSTGRTFASGIRNPVGLAFNPVTNKLWAACNERDYAGDDLVPDFLTSIKPGGFYGWPWYYIGANHDRRLPERSELKKKIISPELLFQAHSAPLGLSFYTGSMFPREYKGDAFVAFHGSTNRQKRTGYKVVRVRFDAKGNPVGGYDDFITGWMTGEDKRQVYGRPVGILQLHDGSLLIADDAGKKIWRVTYSGSK